jgi:Flp pilus assembly protein TadD
MMATLRSVCDERPRRVRDLNGETPPWLEEIIERLLEKDPARRFQSAAEVCACLEHCMSELEDAKFSGERRRWAPARVWLTAAGLAALCLGLTETAGVTQLFSAMGRLGGDARAVATGPTIDDPPDAADSKAAPSPDNTKPSREEEAEKKYREMVKQDPNSIGALYHLGAVLNSRRKWKEAEEILRRTVELNGADVGARVQLAIALRMQGKFAEAETQARALIRLRPKEAMFHSDLGNILTLQGNFAQAEEAYRESQRLLPNVTTMAQLIGALRSQGKHEEAAQVQRERELLLKKAAEKKAVDPPGLNP